MNVRRNMGQSIYDVAKQTARDLRKRQTTTETKIWNILRDRQFLGMKFYRQYPIIFDFASKKRFFIADFYSYEAKLVIEIDGRAHDYQRDYDEMRTFIINSRGIRVIRFTNEEIENEVEKVLNELRRIIVRP